MRKFKQGIKIKPRTNLIHISNVHIVTLYKEARDHILLVAKSFNIIYFLDTKMFISEVGQVQLNECQNLSIFVEDIVFEFRL